MLVVVLPLPFVQLGPGIFDIALLISAFMTSVIAIYLVSDNRLDWLAFSVSCLVFVRFTFFGVVIILLGDIRSSQLLAFLLPALASGTNALVVLARLLAARARLQSRGQTSASGR